MSRPLLLSADADADEEEEVRLGLLGPLRFRRSLRPARVPVELFLRKGPGLVARLPGSSFNCSRKSWSPSALTLDLAQLLLGETKGIS